MISCFKPLNMKAGHRITPCNITKRTAFIYSASLGIAIICNKLARESFKIRFYASFKPLNMKAGHRITPCNKKLNRLCVLKPMDSFGMW